MREEKGFDREFERVKLNVWQFLLTNYLESFSCNEIASALQESKTLVQLVLRKLSQEERAVCGKDKKWRMKTPYNPTKYGPTVGLFVATEWCLHLLRLAKEGKIQKGTQMWEDAKKASKVISAYLDVNLS